MTGSRPSAEDQPAPSGPEPEPADAWWSYCVLWAQDASVASGLEGLEPGSRVEPVYHDVLAALVSRVPLAEYGDEPLRAHLEDLAWVERTARRHEAVLDVALREATIVPLRLCTLYRDREGVARLLEEHGETLSQGLRRVEGCLEWGVKVFADPRSPSRPDEPPPPGGEGSTQGRGASYLLRRQQERALAEKAGEVRARCVDVVHERVGALSRASIANPPQRPEAHGREQTMLLNGAYLVERDRRAELERVIESLREEWGALGFTIELTGPWPAYNFVSGAAGVMS